LAGRSYDQTQKKFTLEKHNILRRGLQDRRNEKSPENLGRSWGYKAIRKEKKYSTPEKKGVVLENLVPARGKGTPEGEDYEV